jgi:hypothetical protein
MKSVPHTQPPSWRGTASFVLAVLAAVCGVGSLMLSGYTERSNTQTLNNYRRFLEKETAPAKMREAHDEVKKAEDEVFRANQKLNDAQSKLQSAEYKFDRSFDAAFAAKAAVIDERVKKAEDAAARDIEIAEKKTVAAEKRADTEKAARMEDAKAFALRLEALEKKHGEALAAVSRKYAEEQAAFERRVRDELAYNLKWPLLREWDTKLQVVGYYPGPLVVGGDRARHRALFISPEAKGKPDERFVGLIAALYAAANPKLAKELDSLYPLDENSGEETKAEKSKTWVVTWKRDDGAALVFSSVEVHADRIRMHWYPSGRPPAPEVLRKLEEPLLLLARESKLAVGKTAWSPAMGFSDFYIDLK